MILVGVAGNKGSGKNTFAKDCINELSCNYGRRAFEMSWAELLKISAAEALGVKFEWTGQYLKWADDLKSHGYISVDIKQEDGINYTRHEISGREYLQNYGTEAHREIFDYDFWVNAFWNTNDFAEEDIVFICDTRFDNEALSIKEHGGLIAQISNDRVDKTANDSHASEVPLPGEYIDVVVDNNGTREDLKEVAETFIASIMQGEELKAKLKRDTEQYHERIDR